MSAFSPRPLLFLFSLSSVVSCLADHGPGTSGSGFVTQTAETLKKSQWSVASHFEWTEFDSFDGDRLVEVDHFDDLDRSYLTTFGLGLGVTKDFEIGLRFGYYAAEGARRIHHSHGAEGEAAHGDEAAAHSEEASHEEAAHVDRRSRRPRHTAHGNPKPAKHLETSETAKEEEAHAAEESEGEFASFDPDGWTDLWLTAKYRVYHGPAGQLAMFGGIKLPVGETRVLDSQGERVEPASTPGTGAWDGMLGAAYTLSVTPTLALDASAQYTMRGEKFSYRLGNRFDAGISAGWRVYGGPEQFPQVVLQGEASVRYIEKSDENGKKSEDTGGSAVYLAPGVRVAFNPHASWSAGVQLPVLQDLNGTQVETRFRVVTSVSFSF